MNRFDKFTESEKCSILEGLKREYNIYKYLDKEKDGITAMLIDLIKECEL